MRKSIIFLAGLGMGMPAMASEGVEAGQTDKVTCKTVKTTGSRLSRQRICMTQRDRDEEAELSRKGVSDSQKRGQITYGKGAGG